MELKHLNLNVSFTIEWERSGTPEKVRSRSKWLVARFLLGLLLKVILTLAGLFPMG